MTKNFFTTFIILCILTIIWPLMIPGYIFSLDQVLNPNGWIGTVGSNIYWVWVLSQVFVFFSIPIWIMEKLLVIMTFTLPCLGMYLLLKNTKQKLLLSGILFWTLMVIFNPFIYGRFIDGQINVYLTYAMYPLLFYFLQKTLKKTTWKNISLLWLWSVLLCLTSIHNAIFLFFIFTVFWVFHIWKIWIKNIWKMALWLIAINMLWLIPFFVTQMNPNYGLVNQIDNFWEDNRWAFQTVANDSNIAMSVLSMNGYWGENENRFRGFTTINSNWKNIFYMLFLIVIVWVFSKIQLKKKRLGLNRYERSLITLMLVSFILAHGNQWNHIFVWVNSLLYDYFPFYNGMREPHKWVMFLVIWYAYFGALWVNRVSVFLEQYLEQKWLKNTAIWVLALMPIIYIPVMFFWLFGQISIHKYPQEWSDAKAYIDQIDTCEKEKCYSTLVFPWHAYMSFNFANKITLTGAVRFMWNNMLSGDNLEIRDIYSTSNRPESKVVEKYIWPWWLFRIDSNFETTFTSFRSDIQSLWIEQILILKEVDYIWYENILKQAIVEWYLSKEFENSMVVVYRFE